MTLAPGEVHVWVLRLDAALEAAAEAVLDRDERDRAARFAAADARRRFERRRAGLRRILAAYLGAEPADVVVERACARCGHPSHGKPRLPGGPAFSTAASGDVGVVAVAKRVELGVDVESAEAVASALGERPPGALMTAAERRAVGDGSVRLETLWVRKEALAKGIGTGLVADPAELDTAAPGGGWLLHDLPVIDGHAGALATSGPVRSVLVREWE
jgi:4'-phosphopantetheinyl transferase